MRCDSFLRMWRKFFRNLTIEPAYFLFALSQGIYLIVAAEFYISKVCLVNLGFNKTICDEIQIHKEEQVVVQKYVSSLRIYNSLLQAVPSVAFALFAGAWSDIYGRKPLILISLAGFVYSNLVYIVNAIFFHELRAEYLMFECLQDLTGGYVTFFMAMNAHIADIVKPMNRTKRMAFLGGLWPVGSNLGKALGSVINSYHGFIGVFTTCLFLIICCFAYVYWFVEESIVMRKRRLEKQAVIEKLASIAIKENENDNVMQIQSSMSHNLREEMMQVDTQDVENEIRRMSRRSITPSLLVEDEIDKFQHKYNNNHEDTVGKQIDGKYITNNEKNESVIKTIKEEDGLEEDMKENGWRQKLKMLFNVENVVNGVKTLFLKRDHNMRIYLVLIVICFEMEMFINVGEWGNTYLYLRRVLDFNLSDFTKLTTSIGIIGVIAQYITIPLLSERLGLHDSTIILMDISTCIIQTIIVANATAIWQLYLAAAIAFLDQSSFSMLRCMLSKYVHYDELGKVLAVVGALQSFMPMISTPFFSTIYKSTVETVPNTYLFVIVGFFIIDWIILFFIWQKMVWNNAIFCKKPKQHPTVIVVDDDSDVLESNRNCKKSKEVAISVK